MEPPSSNDILLPPYMLDVKYETTRETFELYISLLLHEVEKTGMELPEFVNLFAESDLSTGLELPLLEYVKVFVESDLSRKFRDMTNKFVTTPARRMASYRVEHINVRMLNEQMFKEHVTGLCRDRKVTAESILMLFYFCTDLSIRLLRENRIELFNNVFFWTNYFMSTLLSSDVCQLGGWEAILKDNKSNKTFLFSLGGWEAILRDKKSIKLCLGISMIGIVALAFCRRKFFN